MKETIAGEVHGALPREPRINLHRCPVTIGFADDADVPGIGPELAARIHSALHVDTLEALEAACQDGRLLAVDREYRQKAEAGALPTIAPKRFNPEGNAWLPILHASRDGWHFTALYSNTARAHELGTTRDWVVIYFHDDRHEENQHTVVTQTRGTLLGKRVVRGREAECAAVYQDGHPLSAT
jgi:hypothetical protein